MEWVPVYHIRGWGKFNRNYGDFCTGADKGTKLIPPLVEKPTMHTKFL
jgi:hypothetical protein